MGGDEGAEEEGRIRKVGCVMRWRLRVSEDGVLVLVSSLPALLSMRIIIAQVMPRRHRGFMDA